MSISVLSGRTSPFAGRYAYCAKCGDEKSENRNYVHELCTYIYRPGGFHFCAVCDKPWDDESRDYVCMGCIVR